MEMKGPEIEGGKGCLAVGIKLSLYEGQLERLSRRGGLEKGG
jgi:hypothetical protein